MLTEDTEVRHVGVGPSRRVNVVVEFLIEKYFNCIWETHKQITVYKHSHTTALQVDTRTRSGLHHMIGFVYLCRVCATCCDGGRSGGGTHRV